METLDFPTGYEPREELGEGSMGSVWLAWSKRAQGHCAVKVLSHKRDKRGSAERSFNREVRAMARLDHDAVISVYDYGRTNKGSPYVAMEYVPGGSLHAYTRGHWTWGQLWLLIDRLLSALGHAHARDFVHRDLKPGNVLLVPHTTGPDAVKLVDFGIAVAMDDAASAARRIEGTPAYIAPEAAKGDVAATGPWTDIYSLGVILFEILTGDLPYHGRHLLAHHQHSPLPPIVVREEVEAPAGLVPIVARMLAKASHRRLRSVAHVRAEFAKLGAPPEHAPFAAAPKLVSWDDDEYTAQDTIQPLSSPTGPALFHLREPPLAGREHAQEVLRREAERAIAGEGPRVVVLQGKAGVGKSRLGRWLREWLDEDGLMRTLLVRSEPQTTSGGGLRQAVLRFIGAPTAKKSEANEVLSEVLPEPEDRQNAIDVLWNHPNGEGKTKDVLVSRAARVIRDLAGDAPFLFWCDDAQWSPEGRVVSLIDRLAREDGPPNLLMVITLRPSERSTVKSALRRLKGRACTSFIELGPLTPLDLAPALEALAPLPPGIAQAAAIQAAGNPFFAVEAVRSFLDEEGLGSAPADPNQVLEQRVASLAHTPEGALLTNALARATLLGRSFTSTPLARLCAVEGDPEVVCDLTAEQVELLVEPAVEAGLLVEQGDGRWRFNHDLVRAKFRQLCRALPNWARLNLATAALKGVRAEVDPTGIELEMVARHHWEGQEHARAMELGLEGVRRLHESGLMGHATSFVRRLLEWDRKAHLLDAEARGELLLLGSEAAEHAGQLQAAEEHASAAVELAWTRQRPRLGAMAASRVGVLRIQADDTIEAERWLWDALRFARQSSDARARSNAHLSLGRFYQHRENLGLALTAYEASLESARAEDLLAECLAARSAISRIDRIEGRLQRAEEAFADLVDEAQEVGLEVFALNARLELGICAWAEGEAATAQAAFEEVRHAARGQLFRLEFYACLGEAWARGAQGKWRDAEMVLMQAEELRFDVRLHDAEAERLRRDLRELATAARRRDLVSRIDRLDVMVTRTHSTHGRDSTG